VKFYYDKEAEDMISSFTNDLMGLPNIPTLEMGKNIFWQMTAVDNEKLALKSADKFFKDTFNNIHKTNDIVTVIRFKWTMSNMYSAEDVLVFFLFPPDELKKKLNSIFKMKAFW